MATGISTKTLNDTSFESLKGQLGYKNKLQAPKMVKVVIATGTGKIKDKKKIELIADRMNRIAGQKVVTKTAKKSIATFKSRQGDAAGYQVTLRGDRMVNFLNKLINIALPRTKDFRGIDSKVVDSIGNMTIGIKEHTIFPETGDEDVRDIFSFAITIVTTAKTKKEAEAFFRHIGVPLQEN